jgi:hypothetical protein
VKRFSAQPFPAIITAVVLVALPLLIAVNMHLIGVQSASNDGKGPRNSQGQGLSYWNQSMNAFTKPLVVKTNSALVRVGNAIIMPNGLKIQVTNIQRNWQPSLAIQDSLGRIHDGDNPTGKEIILVWFKASDVGNAPIGFLLASFSLAVQGRAEQRVANLEVIPPQSFGSMNNSPWLLPGQSMTTFVPFLVTPSAKLGSFKYYIFPVPQKGSNALPQRLSINLSAPPVSSPDANAAGISFVGDKTITVGP